jgi:hypothetical protein
MLSVTNKPFILSVIVLDVIMLNAVMLRGIMLRVVAPFIAYYQSLPLGKTNTLAYCTSRVVRTHDSLYYKTFYFRNLRIFVTS